MEMRGVKKYKEMRGSKEYKELFIVEGDSARGRLPQNSGKPKQNIFRILLSLIVLFTIAGVTIASIIYLIIR